MELLVWGLVIACWALGSLMVFTIVFLTYILPPIEWAWIRLVRGVTWAVDKGVYWAIGMYVTKGRF